MPDRDVRLELVASITVERETAVELAALALWLALTATAKATDVLAETIDSWLTFASTTVLVEVESEATLEFAAVAAEFAALAVTTAEEAWVLTTVTELLTLLRPAESEEERLVTCEACVETTAETLVESELIWLVWLDTTADTLAVLSAPAEATALLKLVICDVASVE